MIYLFLRRFYEVNLCWLKKSISGFNNSVKTHEIVIGSANQYLLLTLVTILAGLAG